MKKVSLLFRDFFLDKQREKAKLEAEMKLQVTLNVVVPAGEAKPVAPLGVMLSQYYLPLQQFCDKVNQATNNYSEGIELPVKVKKGLRAKEYKTYIKPPTTSFLIYNASDDESIILNYKTLWDVVRIKALEAKISHINAAKSIFGSLKSSNYFKISFKSN